MLTNILCCLTGSVKHAKIEIIVKNSNSNSSNKCHRLQMILPLIATKTPSPLQFLLHLNTTKFEENSSVYVSELSKFVSVTAIIEVVQL